MVLGREHGHGRHGREAEPAVDVLGRLQDEVAPEAEHVGALVQRPEDRAAVDGAHGAGLEQERGHHPEVAAAASHRPEEIRVLLRAGRDQTAVREHDVHAHEVVDGESVLAAQIADSAAQGEAAHARGREEPARHGQAEGVGRVVHVAPQAPSLDPHRGVLLVDPDPLQAREVEHEAVVAGAETRTVVRPPAYRQEQLLLAGEIHPRHHVRHVRAPRDQGRAPIDHAVVDLAGGIVGGVARGDELAAKLRAQVLDLRLLHRSSSKAFKTVTLAETIPRYARGVRAALPGALAASPDDK